MSRVLFCFVLLTCALAAGCAGNRENLVDTATAAAAPATPAVTAPAAASPGEPAQNGAVTVVDGNQLAARSADTLLCRELLVRGSNQIRRMCGTAEQWKVYERREAQAAAEMVRRMQQGSPDSPQRRR
jgi:hypothetical protein